MSHPPENVATSLKTSGEVISDSLLIVILLTALPSEFKLFMAVVTQRNKILTFDEFKVTLRRLEEIEYLNHEDLKENSVMKMDSK